MTSSAAPIVSPEDLGIYLNDTTLTAARAEMLIDDAQALCSSIVDPLPAGAEVIVKRVAARAYVTITSARQAQLAAGGAPFGAMPGNVGGVWLSRADKADLRRLATGSNAFTINMLPATYTPDPLPVWDVNSGPDVNIASSS